MRSQRLVAVATGVITVALAAAACSSSSTSTSGSSTSSGSQGASTGAASTGTAAGSPIKIGSVGTYSGYDAAASKATPDSLQAWAATTNAAGGINGHPVKVYVEDDGGVAAQALEAVKTLVEKDKVVAIVAQHESGLEQASASYLDAKKIPVIGGPGVGPVWTTDPNFFPISSTQPGVLNATVNGAKLQGASSFAYAYCAELPACAAGSHSSAPIAAKLGLGYSGIPISGTATSYTSECLSLKSRKVQSVFLAVAAATALRVVADCKQNSYTPTFIDNPQNWSQDQLANAVWDGVLFAADAPLWFGDGPGTTAYLAAMKQYEPKTPLNSSGTAGWYAGQVFGKAATAAIKTGVTPTSEEVYAGLYSLGAKFDLGGILPAITYSEGKPAVQQECGWYMEVKAGKETAPQGTTKVCTD